MVATSHLRYQRCLSVSLSRTDFKFGASIVHVTDIPIFGRKVKGLTSLLNLRLPFSLTALPTKGLRDSQADLLWVAASMQRRSPIPALTGLDVEQRCRWRPARCRYATSAVFIDSAAAAAAGGSRACNGRKGVEQKIFSLKCLKIVTPFRDS